MTIMQDEDEDSDCLYIAEEESANQNTSPGNTAPESNKTTSELRNLRKNPEPPLVNYLPLMRNFTLDKIKDNMLNASERKPKITVRDFARIPDGTISSENGNSAVFSSLNSTSSYAGTAEDQRVPIAQNPFGVHNANMPHMPSAPSMKASVIIPNPGIHSGGAMTYGPQPLTQGHNGVYTNFPTAMTNVWPVQNGHQAQMYTDAYKRQYGHNSAAPVEYNEHATEYYNQRAPPPINCPPGCYCRHQMKMSAHPSNPQPTHDPRLPPYMYSMGMTSNGQRLASKNPHDERPPMPSSQNFPWNGYRQAYGTNSIPQNSPYSGRDTPAYFAEMHKQRNAHRLDLMRIITTNLVSASARVKDSTNNTQILINTNSAIPANSTHNNLMGDSVGLNIPNLAKLKINNAFETEETTARKRNTSKNTITSKAKASIPVHHQGHAPSNMGIPTRNNIEIPSITSASAEHSNNNIPNLTQPPLNTDTHLTTMTTNTPEANIAAVSQYIDIDKVEATMNKEDNLQPTEMNISNDGAKNVLMEAPQRVVNINMNRDSAQIPLIMNQQGDISLNNEKAHVKTSMLNSDGNLAALNMTTTAETLQNSAFIQPHDYNTKWQIALNLLNNNNNKTQTDATPTPKILVQASSNAYEVKVSTTPTTTERISHNIESNAVLTSATMNAETDSIQGEASENSILKTIDNRTETIVTTVGVVNHIPDISIQALKDILNNAQQISNKTASIDDHTHDNQVSKCDDTENYTNAKKNISHATADDHSGVMIVSKQDEKLEIARKKLARLRVVEHENSSCKHVEKITQRDTENQYQIKITIGTNGEYITQVTSVSSDRSSVEQDHVQADCLTSNTEKNAKSNETNENVLHSQRRQETEVLDRNRSIENNQEINEASEPRQNLTNITRDEAKPDIDETIFFKFQIGFFRVVQEQLSENNCLELADELSKDIHDLIAICEDERSNADIKYKCNVCRNTAVYSPRSLYYEVTNNLEECLDKTRNCPLCITFRKKYIGSLIKYIKIRASEEALNSRTINFPNECQSHPENSVPNQKDGLPMDSRQEEYSDPENQLSLITIDVPSFPKKDKIGDQARANAKHVLDVSKTTQDGNTNAFVVKLPRNRLKESTVKALIQYKTAKSNAIQTTLNIGLDDNIDKNQEKNRKRKSISSETYPELQKKITTETTTRTNAPHFTTHTLNVASNNKENHNNIERECVLREITDTSSRLSKTNTSSDATSTEANNKSISENLPETTTDMVEKDDASRSDEKRENNEKRQHLNTLNDGGQMPLDNHDESGDATQSVEQALSDCQNTIKENCIFNEQELPQVKIYGKKQKNKITKSKDHRPLKEIYRCSECTVGFSYPGSCLSHMTKNHKIRNPVVPLHCRFARCAFCDIFVMSKLYNTHIQNAHNDIFTKGS